MNEDLAVEGVHVRRYKNLQNVYLPWSDGVAIFGVNGAGKTNLLECLALLAGTARTVALAAPRLSLPDADALSLDVRVDGSHLPFPPDQSAPFLPAVRQLGSQWPLLERAVLDADWWSALGATTGHSFGTAFERSSLPEELTALLTQLGDNPVIRYTLVSVDLEVAEGQVGRVFQRTLLTPQIPDWLARLAPVLPDEFAPLRAALAADEASGWWPLLALPGSVPPPVTVEWLARARSSEEAASDLANNFRLTSGTAKLITGVLTELPIADADDPDPLWLQHLVAVAAMNEELSATLPYIRVRPIGEGPADLSLDDHRALNEPMERTRTSSPHFLEPFSSGERRWIDEATATAARALARAGDRWEWQAEVIVTMDEDELVAALTDSAEAVEAEVRSAGYFSAEATEQLLAALDSTLVGEVRRRAAEQDELQQAVEEDMNKALLSLRPHITVRVFDEPEAHLHPGAQRQIAGAVEALRLRGSHVVLTSHSPHFLSLPGWTLVHAQSTPEGSTFSMLGRTDLDARHSLAGQMGLTRGELLTQVGYVLIVEGEADRYVLELFYGQRLREAGVAILRMHGTGHLLATADLDFLQRYLDAPVGVLLDYTRLDVVNSATPTRELGDEEQQLRHLRRECRTRGRRYDEFALDRPDIAAYLDADQVREGTASFAGWSPVLRQYRSLKTRRSFKKWLRDTHGVDLVDLPRLTGAFSDMKSRGLTLPEEFEQVVADIERAADRGAWPTAAPLASGEAR